MYFATKLWFKLSSIRKNSFKPLMFAKFRVFCCLDTQSWIISSPDSLVEYFLFFIHWFQLFLFEGLDSIRYIQNFILNHLVQKMLIKLIEISTRIIEIYVKFRLHFFDLLVDVFQNLLLVHFRFVLGKWALHHWIFEWKVRSNGLSPQVWHQCRYCVLSIES